VKRTAAASGGSRFPLWKNASQTCNR
jgi:hypothetical protein